MATIAPQHIRNAVYLSASRLEKLAAQLSKAQVQCASSLPEDFAEQWEVGGPPCSYLGCIVDVAHLMSPGKRQNSMG